MATLASTVTQVVTTTVAAVSASASASTRATPQGGILEGANPTIYNPKDPITIWIIQVVDTVMVHRSLLTSARLA